MNPESRIMESTKAIEFDSTEYQQFLKDYRNLDDNEHRLIVYAGAFDQNRNYSVEELKRETVGDIAELDLAEIITPYESESYEKIDTAIEAIDMNKSLVIFRNAQHLCGVYTGFTYSVEKYATPQEKYFLDKIRTLPCPVVIVFNHEDQLDRTIIRRADHLVLFKEPTSFFERIAWKIKQVRINGSNLSSPRPV